jgi:hypothetical protein
MEASIENPARGPWREEIAPFTPRPNPSETPTSAQGYEGDDETTIAMRDEEHGTATKSLLTASY